MTDADNFPTDRYVLEGLGELVVFAADRIDGPTADDVERVSAGRDVVGRLPLARRVSVGGARRRSRAHKRRA